MDIASTRYRKPTSTDPIQPLDLLRLERAGELAAFLLGPASACEIEDEVMRINLSKVRVQERQPATGRTEVNVALVDEDPSGWVVVNEDANAFAALLRVDAAGCEAKLFCNAARNGEVEGDAPKFETKTHEAILNQAAVLAEWGVVPESLLAAHTSDQPATSFLSFIAGQPALRMFAEAVPQQWEVMGANVQATRSATDARDGALAILDTRIPFREKQLLARYWANINLILLSLRRDDPLSVCWNNPAPFLQRAVFVNREYDYWQDFERFAGYEV